MVLADGIIMVFDLHLDSSLVYVVNSHLIEMVYGIIEKFSILAKLTVICGFYLPQGRDFWYFLVAHLLN